MAPKEEDKLREELEAMPLWELSEWEVTKPNLEKKKIIRSTAPRLTRRWNMPAMP